MPQALSQRIIDRIGQAAELYYRLILVVGPVGSGKTRVLHIVSEATHYPLLNISLFLAHRMLELTRRQRVLQLPKLLYEAVDDTESDIVLLDNIELLFDIDLQQDPLRLLQGISRSKTIVTSWPGSLDGSKLIYAEPNHAEYRTYKADTLTTLETQEMTL